MRVLILGGDGYLGWPTAMHLTSMGYEVAVADNYLRRRLCREENITPLFQVPDLNDRVAVWESVSGYPIRVFNGDLAEWVFVESVFRTFMPNAIVHFAEQPSAPYSMLNHGAAYLTLKNNVTVTFNLIYAVKKYCSNAHIVKLGTMGEYGTPNIDIEEGWLDVNHKGRRQKFLYPRQAGSLYHTTKIMDTDLLWFYVRMWDLRVTDLMQGPVYGLFTNENEDDDERLFPFFNYDEIFGTVLNRFVVQAAVGYPLTVYGNGGQIRGYLNIKDTLHCVKLSLENPAKAGELRILNQFTETFSVNDLSKRVQRVGDNFGLDVKIQHIENPRKEAEEHYYNPKHTGLLELGLKPNYLTNEVLEKIIGFVLKYKDNINIDQIYPKVKWV